MIAQPFATSLPRIHRSLAAGAALLSLLALAASPLFALPPSDQTPEYTVLQDRPDRLIVTLPNGLIVIAQQLPTAPVVSAQVWVKTGSVYEQEHVGAGLSHFLEHLLAGGSTSTRTEQQTNAILGQIGAQTNAATSLDTVHYYINTLAAHAPQAIDLLSDWMQNSLISQAEYQREREVIQREFDMGQGDPARILWKLTQQARYTSHPARHPTIGYLDEFLSISRDEIYDFYRRMYVPNNMVFAVVGDIDKQQVINQIADLWIDTPSQPLPQLTLPIEPPANQPRTLQGAADIEKLRLRLAWPGTRLGQDGDYALDLLAVILGQGESSRLIRTVRDEQRLVNRINAYNLSFNWGAGFFAVDCELAQNGDTAQAATAAILDQVAQITDQPVTDAELARAKRQILSSVIMANQTADGIASRLASDLIGRADPDYLAKYAQAIQSLTASDLQQTAQRFLQPQSLITVTLQPQEKGATSPTLARPPESADAAAFPHEPVNLDNAALVRDLAVNLTADDTSHPIEVDPLITYQLDSGLRLLVQRSTVVPAVAMQMYTLGGLLADEPGREGVANAMAAMMIRGTATRSAQQIAEALEDLGASLSVQSGNNSTYATSVALKADYPAVLGLFADVILNPTFPDDEWAKLQPRLLAAIDRQRDSWHGELREKFRPAYYVNHPWSQSPLGRRDLVQSLTPDDLRAFHANHFTAANTVFVVVGDVEPEQVRAQVESLFSTLPAQPAVPFVIPQPADPVARLIETPTNKPIAAIQIGLGPGITRTSPDYPTMQVLSSLMSDFPAGWLEQQLRGNGPGLVYAVGAGSTTGLVPGYFSIVFNTTPAQTPEALRRTFAVIDRAKQGSIDQADLARAKAKVLTEEFFAKQSNSDRAASSALNELYGIDDPGDRRFMLQVQSMDAPTLRAAAEKYLQNPVVLVLTNEPIDQQALQNAVNSPATDTVNAAETMQTTTITSPTP